MADLDHTPSGETAAKPPGFSGRKDKLGDAYRGKRAYKTIPYDLIQSISNSPFSDEKARIITHSDFCSEILEPFNKAELSDGWTNREFALLGFLHLLAMPIEVFDPPIDWAKHRKKLKDFPKQAAKAISQVSALPVHPLQAKADALTNFSSTGHILNAQRLVERITADLNLLSQIAAVPEPEKSPIAITKAAAERSRETQRARLLKRDLPKFLKGRNHKLIANAINLAHCPMNPLTADDVLKA